MSLPAALRVTAAALLISAAPLRAQMPFGLEVREGAPIVRVQGVLDDPALEDAVRSGLPLRMRFRLELWRDELFDDLVQESEWSAVVAFEPLEGTFLVGETGDTLLASGNWTAARAVLERPYQPALRPRRAGRYYYIGTLEIETLSLSDLDELERWLRGDLEPAVRGRGSVGGAVGTGLKRVLIRVLGLPARRYEDRSELFLAP